VNYHHALKNAVLPVITVIGIEAAFLIGGLIVTETVFNIPGVARFPGRGAALARLPDRAKPRDVHRRGRGRRQFHRRHALRRDRPAHPIRRLAAWRRSTTIANCGAPARIRRRVATPRLPGATLHARHHRPRHHGAVRMGCGVSADLISRFDPLSVDSAHRLAPPSALHWFGPTRSAAMSGAASSMARASRSPSASAPPRWDRRSASSSGSPPAISPAGSIFCSSASPTSCRRCRYWCWRW
jgi:hypothetical protein